MKSDRNKLRDAIVKYSAIKIEKYRDNPYCTDYKHPKTGKKVTWSAACSYKEQQLTKILDKFFPIIEKDAEI